MPNLYEHCSSLLFHAFSSQIWTCFDIILSSTVNAIWETIKKSGLPDNFYCHDHSIIILFYSLVMSKGFVVVMLVEAFNQ